MTTANRSLPRRATIGLWVWFGIATTVILTVVVVNGGTAPRIDSVDLTVVFFWMLAPSYAFLGVVIAIKEPDNRIATLFLLVSAGLCVEAVADTYLPAARPDPPGALDVAATLWANLGFWLVFVLPIAVLLHVFPDGRLPGSRWRWVNWATVMVVVTLVFSVALSEELPSPYPGAEWSIDNPFGVSGVQGLATPAAAIAFGIGMWSLLLGGVVSMVRRFRRATVVVRAQIKWVGYAVLIFMLTILVAVPLLRSAGILLTALSGLFIPVSVALAITRYRLYDIDRIISRAVTYGVVALVLGGVFALLALLPTIVLGASDFGETPSWVVALTTLVVFALFTPVRTGVQRRVDRRFNRARYDAEVVVESFARAMRDETDLLRAASGLGEAAVRVVEPTSCELWFAGP